MYDLNVIRGGKRKGRGHLGTETTQREMQCVNSAFSPPEELPSCSKSSSFEQFPASKPQTLSPDIPTGLQYNKYCC